MKCDAKQFAEMYRNIYKDLYRFALCMMKNPHDAEDAVSETVVQAYHHIASLRKEEAFKNWMFQILVNVCRKKMQKEQKEKSVEYTDYFEKNEIAAPERDICLAIDIQKAFEILSEEERLIIGLSVMAGYQSKEIGKLLKIKESTVRSKRMRALAKMSLVLDV